MSRNIDTSSLASTLTIELLNASLGVTGEAHNPTILHPAFLTQQKIVPEGWRVSSDGIVCTPVMSMVKFQDDLVLNVDASKLQIVDSKPNSDRAAGVAERYVAALPHVRY